MVVAVPMTLPEVVAKVIVIPAARGKTMPVIVNGRPLFTDVGGVRMRLRETASESGAVADASLSH